MKVAPIQGQFSALFLHLVNTFLNLLCHEFVLSTTHRLPFTKVISRRETQLVMPDKLSYITAIQG
jgi:hypothetical protein